MNTIMNEKMAVEQLENNYEEAEMLIEDADRMENFLQRLEEKIKIIPKFGERLANIPILASLIRKYVNKEYTQIPIGTIMAIVGALIYFVSPLDIIPDSIPILGYFDDAAVVAVCWKMVESDVEEYLEWRKEN